MKAIDTLSERAVSGFLSNPSMQVAHLMIVCHSWIVQTAGAKTLVAPAKDKSAAAEVKARSWVVRGDANPHPTTKPVLTSTPSTTFIIAPEPKMTGEERHAAQRAKARRLQVRCVLCIFGAP